MLDVIVVALLALAVGAGITYVVIKQRQTSNSLMAYLRDGIAIVDAQDRIVEINAQLAEYLGISVTEAVGMRYSDLISRYPVNEVAFTDPTKPRFEIIAGERILEPYTSEKKDAQGNPDGKIVSFHEVTGSSNSGYVMGIQVNQLDALRRAYDELSTLDIDSVMLFSLDTALRLTGAAGGYLALAYEGAPLTLAEYIGDYNHEQLSLWLKDRENIVNTIVLDNKPLRMLEIKALPASLPRLPRTEALMMIPLTTRESHLIGLLTLETPYPHRFNDDVFKFIQLLSNRMAVAIENAGLYRQVKSQLAQLQTNHDRISSLEQLKTEMIRLAAHDLSNPLGSMQLTLDLLRRLYRHDEEPILLRFESIQTDINRMKGMIQNILSLEKIEAIADQKLQDSDRVNLREIIHEAYNGSINHAAHKEIEITCEVDTEASDVVGDATQLEEAARNLISNAIKYTPNQGQVKVRLYQEQDDLVFVVEDNGFGIPEDKQNQLFKPFQRIKTVETEAIVGTGLGLHLVEQIINRHRGEIIFKSVYKEGSTFGFRLPLGA